VHFLWLFLLVFDFCFLSTSKKMSSVMWLGGRKGIRPVKTEW